MNVKKIELSKAESHYVSVQQISNKDSETKQVRVNKRIGRCRVSKKKWVDKKKECEHIKGLKYDGEMK